MDKTQYVFGFVLSESCSRMNCHSWISPVGLVEGAYDMGAGEENTKEERGGGEGRKGGQAGSAEIKEVFITLENVASKSQ